MTPTPESVEAARQTLRRAASRFNNNDVAGARTELDNLIGSPTFLDLSDQEQHQALTLAGYAAIQSSAYSEALTYFTRATASVYATGLDWFGRLGAASALKNIPDAALSLTTISQRWPQSLSQTNSQSVYRLAHETKRASLPDDVYIRLVSALFDAGWHPRSGAEPSDLWTDFALWLLEHDKIDRAIKVASRITDPYSIINLRVDNRFSALRKSTNLSLDVQAAMEHQADVQRQASLDTPRSLEAMLQWTSTLLALHRYGEVLEAADQALGKAKAAGGDNPAFDDQSDNLVWVMDQRARALVGLRRWEEATQQLETAVRRPEHGDINVSQAINLGEYYCDLNQAEKGKAAVAEIGSMSAYGRMQLEWVHACNANVSGDTAALNDALGYMSEHRKDAMQTYQMALIEAGRLDAATELLLERLQDPELRADALRNVQEYDNGTLLPRELARNEQWRKVIALPKIQDAIKKVGKIERFRISALPS